MCRRVPSALLLACALVLAGCSGFSGGSDAGAGGAGESGVSVTPAPVPTVEEPNSESGLPPGLTGEGLSDPDALLAAHRSALDTTTYSVRAVVNATYSNGTTHYRSAATARVSEREGRYYYSNRFDRPNRSSSALVRYESYSGGGALLTALTRRDRAGIESGGPGGTNATAGPNETGNTTTYRAIRSEYETDTGLYGLPRYGERIAAQLEATETALEGGIATADPATAGPTPVVLTLRDVRDLRALADGRFHDPREASGRVLIGPAGLLREYRLRYTARTPTGSTIQVTESIVYSKVGRTTVSRPPWYDEALNATNVTVEET